MLVPGRQDPACWSEDHGGGDLSSPDSSPDTSALVAQLAHQLRNPLGLVSAYSQLLLEDDLTRDQRKAVMVIAEAAQRMFEVVGGLSEIQGDEQTDGRDDG